MTPLGSLRSGRRTRYGVPWKERNVCAEEKDQPLRPDAAPGHVGGLRAGPVPGHHQVRHGARLSVSRLSV